MESIVEAKGDTKLDRLDLLDIPYDSSQAGKLDISEPETTLMGGLDLSVPTPLKTKELEIRTEKAKLAAIRKALDKNGYYRIRHYPDKRQNKNQDQKTASKAGPSHILFDQMLGQQMCHVAQTIKNHEKFPQFKYALAAVFQCGVDDFSSLKDYIPTWAHEDAANFFKMEGKSQVDVHRSLLNNTKESHDAANEHKMARHHRFLNNYLQEIEGWSAEDAAKEAQYMSSEVRAPRLSGFHAIADPGGVKGVAEDSTETIALLRYTLEPLGVNVGHWSLSLGKNVADNSYSFSDQFYPQLPGQKVFKDIMKEPEVEGSCSKLKDLSLKAFGPNPRAPAVASDTREREGYLDLERYCQELYAINFFRDLPFTDLTKFQTDYSFELSKPYGNRLLRQCASCHIEGSSFPPGFAGLPEPKPGEYWEPDYKKFSAYLQARDISQARLIESIGSSIEGNPNTESFNTLGDINLSFLLKGISKNHDDIGLSTQMPPSNWNNGIDEQVLRTGLSPDEIRDLNVQFLSSYLQAMSSKEQKEREEHLQKLCDDIVDSNRGVNFKSDEAYPNPRSSSGAKQ